MKCPNCDAPIQEKALVKEFLWEPKWDFWGKQGSRWIICKSSKFIHFKVDIDGNMRHRLAQVSKKI